jgi:sensor domain CHASE-containing protein
VFSAYRIYAATKRVLLIASIAPAAITLGFVLVGWTLLRAAAEKREGRS